MPREKGKQQTPERPEDMGQSSTDPTLKTGATPKVTTHGKRTPTLPIASPMRSTPPPVDMETTPTFSSLVRNKLDQNIYEKHIEPLITHASAKKRSFSAVSAASNESIRIAKSMKNNSSDDGDNELRTVAFQAAIQNINASSDVIEAELDAVERSIKVLMDEYNKGALDINDATKDKEIMLLEKKARNLRCTFVVRRSQTFQLAGEVADKISLEDAEVPLFVKDWSYVDLLVSRYQTPANATLEIFRPRDTKAQDRFRARIFKAYGVNGEASCCLSGAIANVVAAHIVPYNIGENNAAYLFGESTHQDGHVMCPQNGLPMLKFFKEAFDEGKFTIIPGGDNLDEWKVTVLDKDFARLLDKDPLLPQIHGRVLEFKTDFRPAKRYLYFAHLITTLRRQRYECTGWWRDVPPGISDVWATPGEYLRKSALIVLARRVGHMAPKEAAELLGVSDDDVDDVDDESVPSRRAKLFSDTVNLSPRGTTESTALKVEEDPVVNHSAKSPGLTNPFRALLNSGDDEEDEGDEDEDEEEDDEN